MARSRNTTAKTPAEPKITTPSEPELVDDLLNAFDGETPPQSEETSSDETAAADEVAETPKIGLRELLLVYNSIMPSRRRWIRNRNQLRNAWKELFQALEQASGRSGGKADLYDFNWHKQGEKAGFIGLLNKDPEEMELLPSEYPVENDITVIDGLNEELASEKEKVTLFEAKVAELEARVAELEAEPTVEETPEENVTPPKTESNE